MARYTQDMTELHLTTRAPSELFFRSAGPLVFLPPSSAPLLAPSSGADSTRNHNNSALRRIRASVRDNTSYTNYILTNLLYMGSAWFSSVEIKGLQSVEVKRRFESNEK